MLRASLNIPENIYYFIYKTASDLESQLSLEIRFIVSESRKWRRES